jgi:Leucine-rich repeat (LRR) protein
MNSCDIDDWSEISKLGVAFPSLQSLNIIQTQIKKLSDEELFTEFPELKTLNISSSKLESWEEVDKFRHFPSLANLRIFDVPSLEVIIKYFM